ncbi:uncharacterized protein LOC135440114 [Drosophila montana]|uniref:uncharacterized protein LOC135440114 n=1 Tax=Drosophila montana TaxID=40370 RepID=UPI00313D7863
MSADPGISRYFATRGGRVVATIKIGEEEYAATLDTGATRSFISGACEAKVAKNVEIREAQTRIRPADGSGLDVARMMHAEISLAGRTIGVPLLIMASMVDQVIQGMDFLHAIGTRIRCGDSEMTLRTPERLGIREGATGCPAEAIPEARVPVEPRLHSNVSKMPLVARSDNTGVPKGPGVRVKGQALTEVSSGGIRGLRVDQHLKARCWEGWMDPAGRRINHAPQKESGISHEVSSGEGCGEEGPNSEHSRYEAKPAGASGGGVGAIRGLKGESHIASHRIVMKDNEPIKQRYYPRNPVMQRVIGEQSTYARVLRYKSTLDLKQGYWQIPMEEWSRQYTTFTFPGRKLKQWKVMPIGLHSACATFQRALDSVIGPQMEPHAFAYLDDIIVKGATKEQHVANMKEVLRRQGEANLRLIREKCGFFRKELGYLGHVELRQCLGMASWYRRFVTNFGSVVQPMTAFLKKEKAWSWGVEQQDALEQLKERLTTAPIFACPDFSK